MIDELSRPDSPAVTALRRAVRDRFGDQVATQVVLRAVDSIRSAQTHAPPDSQGAPPRVPPVPPRPPRAPRQSTASGSSLSAMIAAGLLPEESTIECRLYGVTHAGRIRSGRIELNGQTFDSPSAAASALRNGKASNGWVIWKYKGELLAELRSRLPSNAPGEQGSA